MANLYEKILLLTTIITLNFNSGLSQGCWADDGWVLDDPAGPTGPGFDVNCDCASANAGTSGNTKGVMYNNANIDLTQTGSDFCYTFELNFGSDPTQGDGFVFLIGAGNLNYGGDGGNLGYANGTISADHLAFEWDSYENDASVYDGAGATAPHIDINGWNGGYENLVDPVDIGTATQEIDGNAVTSTICWVSDGSGGGTFTMTYGGTSLSVTFTATELAAYDWATAADFTFISVTNPTTPQDQSACIVLTTLSANFFNASVKEYEPGKVKISWETINQKNTSYFIIKSKIEQENWRIVKKIEAIDKELITYEVIDRDVSSGNVLYTVSEVTEFSINEKEIFRQYITVKNKQYSPIKVNYSNGLGTIFIENNDENIDQSEFSIYSISGNIVYSSKILLEKGSNINEFNVMLKPGIYYGQLRDLYQNITVKFMVN